MKKIDLDSMSEQELRNLNREIVRRLEMHALVRNKMQLMSFRAGDRVAFETEHGPVTGVITRINQKTASIEGDDGRAWRVSPGYLSKIARNSEEPESQKNLFHIQPHGSPKSYIGVMFLSQMVFAAVLWPKVAQSPRSSKNSATRLS